MDKQHARTFYTSDTHFSHARIIELCNRPFNSIAHMDAELIRLWNETVSPEDTVYHMGDVALGRIAESLPLVGQLNGTIHLVPGNHDRVSAAYEDRRPKFRDRFLEEYSKVFASILPETYQHRIDGRPVLLSHYPYFGDSQENDRHIEHRPIDEGQPLIHGHIHDTNRRGVTAGNMYHVGMDVSDFRPVPEERILAWMDTL